MKWPTLLQRGVRQVMLQYLETLDVLLNHRMHVNTRLQLRPEVRAACARALWNPFLSVCFCLLITWHHKPSKTERDSQRLIQIMLVRTQTAPQLVKIGVMLLNATWRLNYNNTPELKKGVGVGGGDWGDVLLRWGVNKHLQLRASHGAGIL